MVKWYIEFKVLFTNSGLMLFLLSVVAFFCAFVCENMSERRWVLVEEEEEKRSNKYKSREDTLERSTSLFFKNSTQLESNLKLKKVTLLAILAKFLNAYYVSGIVLSASQILTYLIFTTTLAIGACYLSFLICEMLSPFHSRSQCY